MILGTASQADNFDLIKFFGDFHLPGLVELKIDRGQDFFAPYRALSDEWTTYMLRDETDGKIQATATFIFREVFFQGEKTRIAFAKDLRVAPNRRAVLNWSQYFLPVMQQVLDQNVSHIFSHISMSDPTALNAFVRPRPMKRPLPRYFLYRKFSLVSLHGRFPWAQKRLSSIRIRKASPPIQDALVEYLVRKSQYRPFSVVNDEQTFLKKMNRLKGMKLSDFYVAFDSLDNVIGCTAPWSPGDSEKLIPLSYSLRAHNFRQFLKFGSLFGMTRPLAKPVSSTGRETPLKFKYLTFTFADNEDIFENLLFEAYENAGDREFLMYAHCNQDFRLRPPRTWVAASQPYALYSVVPPLSEPPSFLNPSEVLNPEIEAYFI